MAEKERFIDTIIDMELEMFLAVPSNGQADCQHNPEGFKFHRRIQFCVWSTDTLASYREDLDRARQNGDNLVTIKYARMQGLLPRRNPNPLIDEIVRIKMDWQKAMFQQYPAVMHGARPLATTPSDAAMTSFKTYAQGELETYSNKTLSSLHADMQQMLKDGINASERIYTLLVEKNGFGSLLEAEAYVSNLKKEQEQ